MAAPDFLLDLPLSRLSGWWLSVECCGRTLRTPFKYLAAQRPRATLGGLILALRCRDCGRRPGCVVLLDDSADGAHGRIAPGAWRIEIVLPER
jgi:hypothetical protein